MLRKTTILIMLNVICKILKPVWDDRFNNNLLGELQTTFTIVLLSILINYN